jgi:hypothetical protein
LDTLLTLLARDSLSDATPLEALIIAADDVTRFLAYLAPLPPSTSTTTTVTSPSTVAAWQLIIPTTRHQAAQATLRVLSSRSASPVVAVSLDTQQLYMILLATRVLIQTIGEAISSFAAGLRQARAPPQSSGSGAASAGGGDDEKDKSRYMSLFHELEDMQLSVFQSCSSALKNAQSYQYQQDNKSMSPATGGTLVAIAELAEISSRHAMTAQSRLVGILGHVRSLIVDLQSEIARRPRDTAPSSSNLQSLEALVSRMDTVFTIELKDNNGLGPLAREFENLHVSLQQYGSKLLPGGESPASVPLLSARALRFALAENFTTLPFASFAVSSPITQNGPSGTTVTAVSVAATTTSVIAPWEQQATGVRRQLSEAASMRNALEEAEKKLIERKNELFVLQKQERDDRAMIDVLQMHMKKLAPQAEQCQDYKLKLERSDKELQSLRDKFDSQTKETQRLSNELGKQRLLAVGMLENKYQDGNDDPTTPGGGTSTSASGVRRVAPRRVTNPADLLAGGGVTGKGVPLSRAAADEISVLQRTVRMLRRQVSDLRGRQTRDDIERTLPSLPLVRSRLVAPGHMSDSDVAALHAQRTAIGLSPVLTNSGITSTSPSGAPSAPTTSGSLSIGVTAPSPRPIAATPASAVPSSVHGHATAPRAFTFAIAVTPRGSSSSPAASSLLAALKTADRQGDREMADKKRDAEAIALQREQRKSADQLSSLSHELSRLSQRVSDFRGSPLLIDLRADYPNIPQSSETKAKIRADGTNNDKKKADKTDSKGLSDEKHSLVTDVTKTMSAASAAIQFASRRAAAAQLSHDRAALAERVAAFITAQPAAATAAASSLLAAASLPSSMTSVIPSITSSSGSKKNEMKGTLIGRVVLPSTEDSLAARLARASSTTKTASLLTRLTVDRHQLAQLHSVFA